MALVQSTILSSDERFISIMKEYCNECGISENATICMSDAEQCCEDLLEPKASFFLIDWNLGVLPINKFLEAYLNAGKPKTKLPVLIYKEEDEKLAEIAMMYELPFIIIGELESDCLKQSLLEVLSGSVFSGEEFKEWRNLEKLLHDKDYDEARDFLESKLADNSEDINYRINLAEVNIQMRDFKSARLILKHLVDANKKSARIFQMLGRCEFALGNKEDAKESMQACHFLSYDNLVRLVDIGNIYLKTGCNPEAKVVFAEALEIKGDLEEAVIGMGTCKIIDGDFRAAVSFIGNTINQREQSGIFNMAGILLVSNKEYKKAVTLYVNAIKYLNADKEPEVVARLFYNMGLAFLKWGKIAKSVRCFEKAYKYDQDFECAKHNMGVLMDLKLIHSKFGSLKKFMQYLKGKENSLLFKTAESFEKTGMDLSDKAG